MGGHGFKRLSVVLVVAVTILAICSVGSTSDTRANPKEGVGHRAVVPMTPVPERPALLSNEVATLTPELLDVTLEPGESVIENKLLHLPASPAPQRADIIWCFDLTSSMFEEIDSLKANSVLIMNGVRGLVPDTDFGVISHMDYDGNYDYCGYSNLYGDAAGSGDYPYMLDQPLTGNLTDVQNAINGLTLGWGADYAEDYGRALWETYNDPGIMWRGGAARFVVQWGDAIPHDCDYEACLGPGPSSGIDPGRDAIAGTGDDLPILDVLNGMAANNICLIPMHSQALNLPLWDCYAGITGCDAFEINPDGTIPGGVDIVDYIVDAIGQQFEHIDIMKLEVCTPGFEGWLTLVSPPAYMDIDLDVPVDLPFDVEITVPEGTLPGEYCFDICAMGDGAEYARQTVCVTVPEGDCDGIHLDIGEVITNPNEEVWVPIFIQDVTGWGIVAIEGEICWCDVPAGLIQFDRCEGGNVVIQSGWDEGYCNICSENCVSFAAASAYPLWGEGVLFYLVFHVSANAKPCMCCDLEFQFVNLYDPERTLEVCLEDGNVCIDWCDIEGYVNYWKCCHDECDQLYFNQPLEGVNVDIYDCHGSFESQYTDAEGHYRFECLDPIGPGCYYCVRVESCNLLEECITAYDASLILQYLVCLDDLMDCPFPCMGVPVYPQMVAADANCSGQITAYDASLVLQYVVGLIDAFPCLSPWTFYPNDCIACVTECPGEVDFIGVRIGEVSGCPDCPPGAAPLAASPTRIRLGRATEYEDRVEIPVVVKNAQGVQSIEMDLAYDMDRYSVMSVVETGLANGFMAFWHAADGDLFLAMAGPVGFDGRGPIATITLAKHGPILPSPLARLKIVDALFNEGTPEALIEGGRGGDALARFALGPISPNPFTGGTTVSFNVPASGHVTVSVYNVNGQLVTTLVDGVVGAGSQSVAWDGRSSAGDRVSRGVYFCRMKAEGFAATEKVVLLQ